MDNIRLNSKEDGMDALKELYGCLWKDSGGNLNQYINGDSFILSGDVSDSFRQQVKRFLEMAQGLFKYAEDKEEFFAKLGKKPDCDLFMAWLKDYLADAIRPYEDAEYLRKMESGQFQKMTSYVFENLILFYAGRDNIDTTVAEQKQILIFRKIMYSFVDMVISYHYNREYAISTMDRMFGLDADKCEIWWKLVQDNEERLWKIMMMRRIRSLENRLDQLVEDVG